MGSTAGVEQGTWTSTIGDPELSAVWKDPDFDPAECAYSSPLRYTPQGKCLVVAWLGRDLIPTVIRVETLYLTDDRRGIGAQVIFGDHAVLEVPPGALGRGVPAGAGPMDLGSDARFAILSA